MSMNQYNPDIISHPGIMIKEKLEELKLTSAELAISMGLSDQSVIDNIIDGKDSITLNLALGFQLRLKIPSGLLMRWQTAYDENKSLI